MRAADPTAWPAHATGKLRDFFVEVESRVISPSYCSNDGDKNARAQESHEEAVKIEAVHVAESDKTHDKSADDGSHDTDDNIPQ
jgi:hypothetical protein